MGKTQGRIPLNLGRHLFWVWDDGGKKIYQSGNTLPWPRLGNLYLEGWVNAKAEKKVTLHVYLVQVEYKGARHFRGGKSGWIGRSEITCHNGPHATKA